MQKIILCLSLLMLGLTTAHANTKSEPNRTTLITYEEFKALDPVRQEKYVQGLQFLFDDWAELQKQDVSIEYQNAFLNTTRPSAFAIFSALLNDANAAGEPRACVYAGFVSNLDSTGRFCQSVEKCGSKAGYVTCNPLVYGTNVCAPQGKSASQFCSSHAKSAEDVRGYVLAHKADFNSLRTSLSETCSNVKNPSVCNAVRFRVVQMYDQVKDQLPASAHDPRTGAAPVAIARNTQRQGVPPGRPVGVNKSGGADGTEPAPPARASGSVPPPLPPAEILGSSGGESVRPHTAAAKPAAGGSAPAAATDEYEGGRTATSSCPAFGRRCDANALLQPLAGPQDSSWAGKTLMNFESAKSLYCSLDPINPQFLSSVREFLHMQEARVHNMAVTYPNCANKRNPQSCIRTTNTYYQCYFKQMEDNFEACVKEAQANRAASKIPNESPIGVVLTPRPKGYDFKLTGSSENVSTFTVESYLGLMFGIFHVDLCKVQMAGGSASPGASSSVPTAQ